VSAPTALLLRAVRIVPVRERSVPGPRATEPLDLLVRGGQVVAVGPDLPTPPGARVLEGFGRWLVPGLWDQHVHMTQWGRTAGRLDVSDTSGPHGVLDLVAAHLRSATTGSGSVVGYGYRSGGWREATSTAALDAVTGDRPVVLVSGDGHNGWLNSAAQRFFGVLHREDAFDEDDWFHLWGRLDDLPGSHDEAARGLREAVDDAASRGVVGIVDMEWGITTTRWAERVADGLDSLRVRPAVYRERLDDAVAAGLRTGDTVPDTAGLIAMGPLKVISDGSLATRTAHCHDPYPARSGGEPHGGGHPLSPYGKQNVDLPELTELLTVAHRHGLEGAVHTIGDAAAEIALDAFAASGAAGSIEHAQLVTRSVAPRMAALHLRASVQPAHLLDDRDLTTAIWPGREDRCFTLRTMLDAGVELALGSDAPVARLDPWLAMAAAVHRADGDREPWVPGEQISAAEALEASVDGAPTVGVGSLADLALLDSDPLAGDTAAACATTLRTTRVALTIVGGRVTHDGR